MKPRHALAPAALLCNFCLAPVAHAQAPAFKPLLENKEGAEKLLASSSNQVTVARSTDAAAPGVIVTIQPGADSYPGVTLKPPAPWDLSAFGHVEARITNLGAKSLGLTLRVDGAGPWQDNPWNASVATIEPGQSATASTIFGYSWGKPGFQLKPQSIPQILLFAGKEDAVQKFRIESIQAAGPVGEKPIEPPARPEEKRFWPENGVLFGADVQARDEAAIRFVNNNTLTSTQEHSLRIALPAGQAQQSTTFQPVEGRWDLRKALQVLVTVRNDGAAPVTPRARVESNGGASDWATTAAPLAPGATGEIAVPFATSIVQDLEKKETLRRFTSDAVSGVTIGTEQGDGERSLLVDSIRAVMPAAPVLPDWLGKRPPVAGEWVQTLDDEFNGDKLDASLWDVTGPNYWDKTSHFSRDNVIIGGGVVRLRYEKKTGFHDDDPKLAKSDYASGYLHSYGKWAQRYGYFEARMKLPRAPGLWPAFWMMPDRGTAVGPEQWKRQDTANGGMEFDILEHLTRWGPNRYNVTMHWDGYGPEHKSIGSDSVYVQPDKDGFITAGLLWTPGLAVYYANGREVVRWENPRIGNVAQVLMFTLPMGGWDNSPLDDALLPDDFSIDYVRVWQRKDLASPTDGKMKAPTPAAP